ncbi:MAG: hypothetical protein ACKVQJ_01720 [Pyrinomonadaceae bacterium]
MKKILLLAGLVVGLSAGLQAQATRLYPKDGRVAGSVRIFSPKTRTDAEVFLVYLRKYQEVTITVSSNSVFLAKENECGMYFRLFDDKGKETKIGDSPAGIDKWTGYVEKAGTYKIRVGMGCLESYTTKQLLARNPKFRYLVEIYQPLAPSR